MSKKNKSSVCGEYHLLIILGVMLLDQATKFLAKTNLHDPIVLIHDFLNLTFIINTGSAFGILRGFNTALIFVSFIVIGLLLFYWDKIETREKPFVALVVGGIIGNLIDRISYGAVIDFIDFAYWPAFNVADSAITIGIVVLIYFSIKE
jgi:signal peptidase II